MNFKEPYGYAYHYLRCFFNFQPIHFVHDRDWLTPSEICSATVSRLLGWRTVGFSYLNLHRFYPFSDYGTTSTPFSTRFDCTNIAINTKFCYKNGDITATIASSAISNSAGFQTRNRPDVQFWSSSHWYPADFARSSISLDQEGGIVLVPLVVAEDGRGGGSTDPDSRFSRSSPGSFPCRRAWGGTLQ